MNSFAIGQDGQWLEHSVSNPAAAAISAATNALNDGLLDPRRLPITIGFDATVHVEALGVDYKGIN